MLELAGKVAIVTGAGRGIGRGIALAFGEAGAKVVVSSRSQGTIDGVVAEIAATGGNAIGITCDVGRREEVYGMVDRAATHYGRIDVLVNNAQSFGPPDAPTSIANMIPVESYGEDEFEHVFRTGMMASWWAMKAVFPHMKGRGGKIINLGSMAGQIGMPGMLGYNVTKESIRALTRTAAREWGIHGINVNVINPSVRTDGLDELEERDPAFVAESLTRVPLGRYGDPRQDAGALAVFLASKGSDFITGQTFMLDGGLYIAP